MAYDPNDPNTDSQAPDFTSTIATANGNQDIQNFINDPRRVAWIQSHAPNGQLTADQTAQLAQVAKNEWGYGWLPSINSDGKPNMTGSNAFAWKLLLAVAGVPLGVYAGTAIAGALGGGAATGGAGTLGATATGGGVGIGETGATAGLAGSGFGTATGAGTIGATTGGATAGTIGATATGGATGATGAGGGVDAAGNFIGGSTYTTPAASSWLTPTTGSLISTGIQTGAGLFGALIQSNASQNNTEAQIAASKYAADLQAKAQADALAFQQQQAALTAAQQAATQQGNYGIYATRQGNLNALNQALGVADRQVAPYVAMPTSASGTIGTTATGTTVGGASGTTQSTPSASDPTSFIKDQLSKGSTPQAAAAAANAQFNLQTGSQAVYYDPSAHGGVATIGLPGAYLAQDGPGGTWTVTARSSTPTAGAASLTAYPQASSGQSIGAMVQPVAGNTAYTPLAPAYTQAPRVFGSIGSMVGA